MIHIVGNVLGIVAPFTGARIETLKNGKKERELLVAPFTGAWIETGAWIGADKQTGSPPSRGRGLKLEYYYKVERGESRPLHGGVD